MLSVKIIAVGKLKEKYLVEAIGEYSKRISKFARLDIVELPEIPPKSFNQKDIEQALDLEGKKILEKSSGHIITLEVEGKMLSSPEMAEYFDKVSTGGVSDITFVIGSSHGLSKEVKDCSDFALSFSKMTFPHQLMRVILLEQVYRAFSILNNTSYHK